MTEEKPYYCDVCKREHKPLYRGKPSKTYQDHKKYAKGGSGIGKVVVNEIHQIPDDVIANSSWNDTGIEWKTSGEPVVGIGMDGTIYGEKKPKLDENTIQLSTVDRMLDKLDVKAARRILEKTTVRPDGYRAVWRVQVWSPEEGKDIPFSIHESQKYKILIELDRGHKFRGRAKKKWRRYLKENMN